MKLGSLFVAFTAYTGVDAYYRAPKKGKPRDFSIDLIIGSKQVSYSLI